MKTNKHLILITIFLTSLFSQANGHGSNNDQTKPSLFKGLDTQAAKVVSQFHKALVNHDVKLANALLSKDVLIYESGNAERSSVEYVSGHMLADMKYLSSIRTELIEHQVKIHGDIAISTSRSKHMTQGENSVKERIALETIVLERIDGTWLITHIHWS